MMKRGFLLLPALCAAAAFAAPASASVGAPPASCADIAAANPSATDGDYTIYPNGETFSVYCADMSGAPKEYLTLQNTDNANYSTIVDSAEHQVRTDFNKVRLDPQNLHVDIADATFSKSTGSINYTSTPNGPASYAEASDCVWYYSTQGRANVDLTGTPFYVNDTFIPQGYGQAGSSVFSDNNQVVNLTGGGYCGGNGPSNQSYLQLGYNGTTYSAAPAITPTVTGTTGNNGWYTGPVKITWASDQPVVASEGCVTDVTTDTTGTTYTCTMSGPGGVSSKSVTIKLDQAGPVIHLTGGGTYNVGDTVTIGCTATDATSGVASSDCASVTGSKPAYEYALGDTQIKSSATDNAGNGSSASETVTVVDNPSGLKSLVGQFSTNPGVSSGLGAKLDAIANAPNGNAKAGQTKAFINQVNAQTGKALTADQAATLIRLVQQL